MMIHRRGPTRQGIEMGRVRFFNTYCHATSRIRPNML